MRNLNNHRRAAVAEGCLGVLLFGLSAFAMDRGRAALSREDGEAERDEHSAPAPAQTLRDTEPPAIVGPDFDHDAAMLAHPKHIASYTLDARLDATLHTVDGKGTLIWEN